MLDQLVREPNFWNFAFDATPLPLKFKLPGFIDFDMWLFRFDADFLFARRFTYEHAYYYFFPLAQIRVGSVPPSCISPISGTASFVTLLQSRYTDLHFSPRYSAYFTLLRLGEAHICWLLYMAHTVLHALWWCIYPCCLTAGIVDNSLSAPIRALNMRANAAPCKFNQFLRTPPRKRWYGKLP